MPKIKNLSDLHLTFQSTPFIIVLESMYGKNPRSPLYFEKSTDRKYGDLLSSYTDLFYNKLSLGPPRSPRDIPFTTLVSFAEMIIFSLTREKEMLMRVMNPVYAGDFLANHGINVAFLSCAFGIGMEYSYRELCELGVAALVHDIGMVSINREIFLDKNALTEEKKELVQEHPRRGAALFEKCKTDMPWLVRVILEEHKREHGAGYPDDRMGELHPYSKIVGLCDSFEALTHERAFRKPYHPADAMKVLIGSKASLFSSDALRTIIDTFGIFPVGSLVRLNNKKTAIVSESVWRAPLRPIVRIMQNETIISEDKVDLSKDNNLSITGIIYDERYQIPQGSDVQ